jgi:serine/threonine protein kinase
MEAQEVINGQCYYLVRLLGTGNFGRVYLAENGRGHSVVKVTEWPEKTFIQGIYEYQLLEWLTRHLSDRAKFCLLIDQEIDYDARTVRLVLEYIDGLNLTQYYLQSQRIEHETVRELVDQLVTVVAALHANGIVHRDLKFDNIMIKKKDGRHELYLIDFGLACIDNEHFFREHPQSTGNRLLTSSYFCGNPMTVSPEIVQVGGGHRQLSFEELKGSDVWAIGCITYQLLYRRLPFAGNDLQEVFRKISDFENPKRNFRLTLKTHPTPLNGFVLSCLAPLEGRPTIDGLVDQLRELSL